MIANPTVSIIIPTYKRSSSTLSRAIESARRQSYKNIEIIIIDDNADKELSKYRSDNVCLFNELFKKDSRIKLILNNTNLGGALSRNEGIKQATGAYITFLDDDDYFLDDKILHQIDYMKSSGVNFSFTDLYLYNKNNKVVDIRDRSDIKTLDKDYLLKYHIVKNITGTETFMISKKLIDQIGAFDDVPTGHEFYLMLKVLECPLSKIGYYKSNDIVAYRTSNSSISNGPKKIIGENLIYKKRREYFHLLTLKEKRLVNCRHRAVLGVSYLRRKKIIKGIAFLFYAFLTSPFLTFKEFFLKQR